MKISELNKEEITPVSLKLSTLDATQIKPVTEPEAKKPGYFARVAGQFKQAGQDIISEVKQGASDIANISPDKVASPIDVLKGGGRLLETGLRTVGKVAGASFAPIMEAPVIKPALEAISGRVAELPGVQDLINTVSDVAKNNPNAAKDVESIINIVTLGGGKAAYAPLKNEAGAIARDVKQATSLLLTPSEEAVQRNVQKLFQKSIKPTGKKTLAQSTKYANDTVDALKTIKANVPALNIVDSAGELISGRAPETIDELSQAVAQTKQLVFNEYDNIARQAGQAGAKIKTKPIIDELSKVKENRSLQLTNPEIIKYVDNWIERLKEFGDLDAETAQSVIQNMNNGLQAFYKSPTYESASRATIDSAIANNFRKSLDNAIETTTGEQYQALKNKYGALKSIENDVVRAANRVGRRNVKGLLDYTDMFTSGQMVGGLLSLNPFMFTKGAIERGIKEYIKFLNDPNRAVKNIFDQLDIQASPRFVPESATAKYLADPSIGLTVKSLTPEKVAKLADSTDINIIKNYLNSNDINSYIDAAPLIEQMGLKSMDEGMLRRFLQEVVDLSDAKQSVKSPITLPSNNPVKKI